MANIFLSYGGSQSLVEPFEKSLNRQGHTVYSDSDFDFGRDAILAKLQEFDAVIVIWSGNSIQRDLTLAVAAEALRLGRLIQTSAPGLSLKDIPRTFWEQRLLAVSDTKSISEAITALGVVPGPKSLGPKRPSRPPGVGAAGGTPYAVDPATVSGATDSGSIAARAASSDTTKALEIEAGRLVHKIPPKMWLGQQEVVEVRLGRLATPDLSKGLEGRGALTVEDIPIVETMSVSLYGGPGAFTIERQSEASQLVMSDLVKGTPFETQDFGRWVWLVTPRKTGAHQLYVKVSAALKDSRGVTTTTKLPDKEFKVSVSVHTGKATVAVVKRTLPALALAALGGLVAAFTRDVWWPKLYAIFKAHGWLS
jgi:hypothetical protein